MILFIGYFFIQNTVLIFTIYDKVDTTTLNIINQMTLFLIPVIIYIIVKKRPISELIALNPIDFKNILFIVAITFLLQPITMVINGVATLFFPNIVVDYITDMTVSPPWLVLISVAVMPSICEELMFRGIIFSEFRNESKSMLIFFPAFYFGIMHMNINQFFYATFLGMIFGYFVIKTKSIFSSMIAHLVINGSQVILLYISQAFISEAEELAMNEIQSTASIIASITLWAVISGILSPIIYLLFKGFNKHNDKNIVKPIFSEKQELILTEFDIPKDSGNYNGQKLEETELKVDTENNENDILIPQHEIEVKRNESRKNNFYFVCTTLIIFAIFFAIVTMDVISGKI